MQVRAWRVLFPEMIMQLFLLIPQDMYKGAVEIHSYSSFASSEKSGIGSIAAQLTNFTNLLTLEKLILDATLHFTTLTSGTHIRMDHSFLECQLSPGKYHTSEGFTSG